MKRSFRLFDSQPAEPIRRKQQITQCDKCLGYHDPRACSRAERCLRCGQQERHIQCINPPKCTNCAGPHQATYLGCPARPKRENGQLAKPTVRQLKAIRKIGQKAFEEAQKPLQQAFQDSAVPTRTADTEVPTQEAVPREQTPVSTNEATDYASRRDILTPRQSQENNADSMWE